MENTEAKRDIWGALIAEQQNATAKKLLEKRLLFVGSPQCGKSTLLNSFFGRRTFNF